MPFNPAACCSCGYSPNPRAPRSTGRALIRVVDELGSDNVCDLCLLPVVARLGGTGEITMLVARPVAVTR